MGTLCALGRMAAKCRHAVAVLTLLLLSAYLLLWKVPKALDQSWAPQTLGALLKTALRRGWVFAGVGDSGVRENTTAGPHPPRSAYATRQYLPAPKPPPAGKPCPFDRMNDQRPFWYQCTDLTQRPETYPPHMPCLQQAAQRIEGAVQAGTPGYPMNICAPGRLVDYYHDRFWNVSKTQAVVGGLHGNLKQKGARRYATFNEEEYFRKYAVGHFVTTKRKGGWDCVRHIEILLAGSLPLFDHFPADPLHALFHHPMECQAQLQNAQRGLEDPVALRAGMHQWFRNHLTCDAMAHFMFRSVGFDPCAETPVLFLDASAPKRTDYMSNFILIGLQDVLGPAVHVWRPVDYLYTDYGKNHRYLYGNGFTYAYTLHPSLRQSPITDQQVRKRLQAKYYKAVMFGSYGRSIPFWKEVVRSLPRNRIWAVNGNDRGPFDPKGPTGIRFHLSGQVNRSTRFVRECQRQCTNPNPRLAR